MGYWRPSAVNETLGCDPTIFPTGRVMAKDKNIGKLGGDKTTQWKKLHPKTAADLVARGVLEESRVTPDVRQAAMVLRVERLDTDTEEGLKALISLMKSKPEETMAALEKLKKKKKRG
jgi:hypothetical protein